MACSKYAERYNMGHRNRGKCLVFNQEVFENPIYNRPGTGADVRRIQRTFSKLGFEVIVHKDFAYNDIMREIETLRLYNHANNDCVCVFVLSHGDDRDHLHAKDVAYSSDKIWKPFTADNCPSLAGKPKLFFFQACRGNNIDPGFLIRGPLGDFQTDAALANSYRIPTMSDFLVGRSSPPGWASVRDVNKGSWYIQSLCDVLDKSAKSSDLVTMHTMTAQKVSIDFETYQKQNPKIRMVKQIPVVSSTLIRNLYFYKRK